MTDATTLPARALRPAGTVWFLASAVLALMTVAPLLWMVSIAFKGPDEIFDPGLIPARPSNVGHSPGHVAHFRNGPGPHGMPSR